MLRCILHTLLLLSAVICPLVLPPSRVSAAEITEERLIGVFIYRLSRFVYWEDEPVEICILNESGDKTIGTAINSIIKKSEEQKISVKESISIEESSACDIVFIDKDSEKNLKSILLKLKGKGVVTMSDITGFVRRGGMFGFARDSSKRIKMKVNYTNVKDENIKINATLFDIIERVD